MNQRHHGRMSAYSEDLRTKIVQALRRGTGKSEVARLFGVSLSSVKRYAKMADEGCSRTPKKRPGCRPKMSKDARRLLEADLEQRPAATLSERQRVSGKGVRGQGERLDALAPLEADGVQPKKGLWVRVSATSG
jgi:transposase